MGNQYKKAYLELLRNNDLYPLLVYLSNVDDCDLTDLKGYFEGKLITDLLSQFSVGMIDLAHNISNHPYEIQLKMLDIVKQCDESFYDYLKILVNTTNLTKGNKYNFD